MKGSDLLLITLPIILVLFAVFILNPIYKKNIQKETEPSLVVCSQCKDTGECLGDLNKFTMDIKFSIWLNNHIIIDDCQQCRKYAYENQDTYCNKTAIVYKSLLEEYHSNGPKMEILVCPKCLGEKSNTDK